MRGVCRAQRLLHQGRFLSPHGRCGMLRCWFFGLRVVRKGWEGQDLFPKHGLGRVFAHRQIRAFGVLVSSMLQPFGCFRLDTAGMKWAFSSFWCSGGRQEAPTGRVHLRDKDKGAPIRAAPPRGGDFGR